MISINFPQIFSSNATKTVKDMNATKQNTYLLLSSQVKKMFGDPAYGTHLLKFMFQPNSLMIRDMIVDDIYNTIALYMPQLRLNRKDIEIINDEVLGKITCKFKATNIANYETDTYQLVLKDQ